MLVVRYVQKLKTFRSAGALYISQVASYGLPLIIIPYLSRVLGAREWGALAYYQGIGQYILLAVEYGFEYSATREVSRLKDDKVIVSKIVTGVLGAKSALSVAVIFIVALLYLLTTSIWDGKLLCCAVFYGITQAFGLLWYFQGLGKPEVYAAIDIINRIIVSALCLLLVHHTGQAWEYLVLQGLAPLLSIVLVLGTRLGGITLSRPSVAYIRHAVANGFTMFFFKASVSLYTTGNVVILGFLLAGSPYIAYYAASEKLIKAAVGLFTPVSQIVFPRITFLLTRNRDAASHLARSTMFFTAIGTTLVGFLGFILSGPLMRLLFGAEFLQAVPILRLMMVLIPLIALSNVLGIQWMVPLGRDKAFNTIIVSAGLINLIGAIALVPLFNAMGMAVAVIISEAVVTASMWVYLYRHNILF